MAPLRVLVSEPNAAGEDYAFLPYVWAVLKSYYQRHGSTPDAVEWLDPIFNRTAVSADLERCDATPPDVLGLSCYTWNWDLQLRIARWAKERNPQCLVVAGGPDPDYKNPAFFLDHPDIDIVVVKDGEIPFLRILETLLRGERDFRGIPGLYLPGSSGHDYTGPAEVPTVFDYSPYLDQHDYYERLVTTAGAGTLNLTWETNRGCPYGCSFCDWGSSTMSKVRKFEMSRVEAEADWIGRMQVNFVFLADANFGIFPRDIEIAERLAATRAAHGFPRFLYYSSAKNNPERTVDIAQRFHDVGLTSLHILSVQHTDPDVLAATARSNISAEKYREVVRALLALDIPSEVQLITGIPGDTPERWKQCLGEVMEWGVHDNFVVFPYSLLPNAPAAAPEFIQAWQVESADRWLTSPAFRRTKASHEGFAKSRVVVASRTFDRADWVEMNTYAAFVKALHNRALTRLPAMYLRFSHGVAYRECYGAIIDGFFRSDDVFADLYRSVSDHYGLFLTHPEGGDEMLLDSVSGYDFYVDASRWIFVNLCQRIDAFYERLSAYLGDRFRQAPLIADAIEYQKRLMILPDYDPAAGTAFNLTRDWLTYHERATSLTEYVHLPDPAEFDQPRRVEIHDRTGRAGGSLMFAAKTDSDRWVRWIDQTVRFSNSSLWSNFPASVRSVSADMPS